MTTLEQYAYENVTNIYINMPTGFHFPYRPSYIYFRRLPTQQGVSRWRGLGIGYPVENNILQGFSRLNGIGTMRYVLPIRCHVRLSRLTNCGDNAPYIPE